MSTWLDDALIAGVKITDTPLNPYATGYGAKIPSAYMLKLNGRWHRVYAMVYGNSGTHYVVHRGETKILELATEHRIEKYREGVGTPTPIDQIEPGGRFRFHHDGVVATLISTSGQRYSWRDYQGRHDLFAGTYSLTGRVAWPYVYPTTEPETEVTLP
jgi:hypothetical protein